MSNQLQSNLISAPVRRTAPAFSVREIPIMGDLILSPMDGYSALPFRLICRELGSAMSYTEFVNVEGILRGHGRVTWMKLDYDPSERPMTFQIYGHEEDRLVEAAVHIQSMQPDIIDINMGCY